MNLTPLQPCLPPLARLRLALIAVPMICGVPAHANGFTDPAVIDRAVSEFTGAALGAPGGARMAADRRLQLASCTAPLAVSWHSPAQTAVRVECPDAGGWRIFIAVNPPTVSAVATPVVKRGDALTIVVRGRGFSVQQAGEAMESGAIGDWIDVRTGRKAQPLRARIERPGLAAIPAG